MFTTQPDELTFAEELRQLRFETEARRIAAARRMGRNAAWMHSLLDRPPQTPEAKLILAKVDTAVSGTFK